MRSPDDVRSRRLSLRVMPSARVRLPGPRHSSAVAKSSGGGPSSRAPPPHDRLPVKRLERANQHRRGRAVRLGHRVHQVVDAVIQVDVGDARRAVERRVARGRTRRGVAGGIGFADVGLGLDDDAGRQAGRRVSCTRTLPIRVARDVERRPRCRTRAAEITRARRRLLMRSDARGSATAVAAARS